MVDRVVRYVFQGQITDLQAKMVAAGKSVGDFADKATRADKEGAKFRQGLSTLGDTAGKVGLVAAAGLGSVVLTAANFDKAMSNVQAATHETAANMDALREAAIQAGADTAFSASEAAAGIENLAKAGVSTKDILAGGLKGALDLAAAGSLEVGQAGEIAATAMTQFGLSGKDIPHVADLLSAAAGKAQGEVTDMANSLKYVGPVAAQMGVSIEETTGAIAELASQGILGDQAGTALRGMLTALTSPSKIAAQEMKNLGISMYDANGEFIGLEGIAGQLHDTMGNLGNAERDEALGRIFGNEQITAARILYAGGAEDVRKWTNQVNDSGYAAETAGIKLDNLAGDFEAFKGSLETALIGAGDGAQGPLRKLVQGATDAVNALNDLPDGAKNAATGLAGITAITGGSLWFGSKVIGGIADTRKALQDLGIQASTSGRIMKKSLATGSIVAGLLILDDVLDDVFNVDIDTTKLGRSLDALASGRVTGEILTQFGSDLSGFASDVKLAASDIGGVSSFLGGIPILGDALGGPQQDALNRLQQMDEFLAGMVEAGQAEQAAAVFTQLSDAAAETGIDVKRFFEQYQIAVDNAAGVKGSGDAILAPFRLLGGILPAVGSAADGAAGDVAGLGGALEDASAKAYTLDDALSHLFRRFDVDAATDAWRESIQGLTKDLEGGAGALNGLTEKGRANKEEIRASISTLRSRAEAQYNLDGNAARLTKTLLRGREAIIKQAKAANIGRDAMVAYLKKLGLTPKEIRTDVKLIGTKPAEQEIAGVQSKLSALDRTVATATMKARDEASGVIAAIRNSMLNLHDKTVYIRAVHTESRLPMAKASGGYISGPGSATSDSIPAYLSNGEYVVKAAAVDKYGVRMFDQLNAMRFAEGGAVRAQRSASYTTNNYGPSGPVQISGRLRMDDGRMADITGVIDDRINANARHSRATGRR